MEITDLLHYGVPATLLVAATAGLAVLFLFHPCFADEVEEEPEGSPAAGESRPAMELLEAADHTLAAALQHQEERKVRAAAAHQRHLAARQERIDRALEDAKSRVIEWARSIGVLEEFLVHVAAEPRAKDGRGIVSASVTLEDLDVTLVTGPKLRIMASCHIMEPVIDVLKAQRKAAERRTAAAR